MVLVVCSANAEIRVFRLRSKLRSEEQGSGLVQGEDQLPLAHAAVGLDKAVNTSETM